MPFTDPYTQLHDIDITIAAAPFSLSLTQTYMTGKMETLERQQEQIIKTVDLLADGFV